MADPNTKVDTPLHKKIVPARGAAQKAAATLKEQNTKRPRVSRGLESGDEGSDSAESVDDEEMKESSFKIGGSGPRGRGRGRGRGKGRRQDANLERTPRRQAGRHSLKSAAASSPLLSRSASPLFSSPFTTPQKRSQPFLSNTPLKRAKVAGSLRGHEPSSSFNLRTPSSGVGSLENCGALYAQHDLVWVRLDSEGDLVCSQAAGKQKSYWWPAQVTEDAPLKLLVKLFGDDGYGRDRLLDIPSSVTVSSFRQEGRLRFSISDFCLPAESPSSDLASCWTAALDQAVAVDIDMEDELPEPPSLLSMMSANGKGKRKEKERERERERERVAEWDTPHRTTPLSRRVKPLVAPLDEEIKAGPDDGELVLARDHKDRPDHWPARVVGVTQDQKSGKWLYEVCYIDGKKKKMDRTRFFSSEQEGFATCQLGKWQTEWPASDTEGADFEDELHSDDDGRSSSPSLFDPDLPDHIDAHEFCELRLVEQMRYVYPFLCRTIRREYEPSFERHDAFMKGGKAREQLGQAASMRGRFSENEVGRVLALIRRAMLRSERWAKRVYYDDEVPDQERLTTRPDWSDETKAESIAESVVVRSSDLDAAMALTELKASEDTMSSLPPSSMPDSIAACHEEETINPADQSSAEKLISPASAHLSVVHVAEMDAASMQLSSPIITTTDIGYSDMKLDSDEEQAPTRAVSVPTASTDNTEKPAVAESDGASQKTAGVASISPLCHHLSPKERAVCKDPADMHDPLDASNVPATSTSRPRPTGCKAYERLPRSERGMYCADVLLPEAVLQLHLLRHGHRSSARLLTPKQEKHLYEVGRGLMKTEVHWITQIVQLRKLAEGSLNRNAKRKGNAPVAIIEGGTSTRPKTRQG